ncbi:molybdenum cofactor biosynthesis protein B [Conexibacter sp. DBS9H8]|uniref:MogA/MoaB family molybdenum cofactor biosynthesis protein n=1 Tax=Conexibacter sp. DBS9H8 TaxID=2937801 RepID=UPI0020106883|nr:MogA/MoaB family molybdenum cofactor biosynthesis protein [Conexibacter sp. DBS9H8]
MRAAIISISTSRSAGAGPDTGGDALARFVTDTVGAQLAGRDLITDDEIVIAARLRHWSDTEAVGLVLTTGGTGFSPRDVTPEATRAVIEREAPGVAEAMRAASAAHTRHWMLSRGVAGIRGRTLIVNFPGSPRSIEQAGAAIAAALPHAVALITGESGPGASHEPASSSTASH